MSAELLGAAFKADIKPHAFKLVMLKLVDAARDDGTKIYPSVETIAKAAGVSVRHTKRVLHGFVGSGLLKVVETGGKGRGNTTEYSMDVALLVALGTNLSMTFENGKGTVKSKGDTAALNEKRVTSEVVKGDGGATQPLKRTLKEDSRESARATGEQTKATFDALCTAWTQGAIGGAGAIGDTTKAMAAIAALDPDDHAMAVERAPRFLRSLRDAKRSYTMGIESYVHGRQFVHHPPPASASGGTIQPVELKPYVKELWAMYWKAVDRARQATGDDRHIRRLRDCTDWLERGVTTGAVSLPSADDLASLAAINIDSPEHLAWQDYATRIGARLPRPDHVPVIQVPAPWPPPLTLAGTKPYRLALPVRIEVRSPAWWWRFFKSIEDGTPIVSTLAGRHRVDLLEAARRTSGAAEVDYGPIPLASELAAMVEVKTLTDAFEQWSTWISARGGDLAMWPHGSIWCPSEYPTLIFGQGKTEAGAAA